MKDNLNERNRDWSLLAGMCDMMTDNLKDETVKKEKNGQNSAVVRGLLSVPHKGLDTIEYEIRSNIEKTKKELEERRKIRRLKEGKNLEYNHTEEIIETYQKLLKISSEDGKPNKELMNIVFDMYAFAYEAGSTEESTKVHFFRRDIFDVDTLLKQGHGELPIYEDDEEDEV